MQLKYFVLEFNPDSRKITKYRDNNKVLFAYLISIAHKYKHLFLKEFLVSLNQTWFEKLCNQMHAQKVTQTFFKTSSQKN